jgi:hypothetical protein
MPVSYKGGIYRRQVLSSEARHHSLGSSSTFFATNAETDFSLAIYTQAIVRSDDSEDFL